MLKWVGNINISHDEIRIEKSLYRIYIRKFSHANCPLLRKNKVSREKHVYLMFDRYMLLYVNLRVTFSI